MGLTDCDQLPADEPFVTQQATRQADNLIPPPPKKCFVWPQWWGFFEMFEFITNVYNWRLFTQNVDFHLLFEK